ncbi:MAG TPA: c-type cytochrome, partial [Chitinophagaceae bacterium]
MKCLIVFTALIIFLVIACNTQTKKNPQATATDSLINSPAKVADSPYVRGAKLISANDCLTCHKLNKKSVGPSYYTISEKYPFDSGVVENLAYSIIHGSKGLYGSKEMTPHPNITYIDA